MLVSRSASSPSPSPSPSPHHHNHFHHRHPHLHRSHHLYHHPFTPLMCLFHGPAECLHIKVLACFSCLPACFIITPGTHLRMPESSCLKMVWLPSNASVPPCCTSKVCSGGDRSAPARQSIEASYRSDAARATESKT